MQLHKAVHKSDIKELQRHLSKGLDVNEMVTPTNLAFISWALTFVGFLRENGTSYCMPERRDRYGETFTDTIYDPSSS